MQSGEYPLETCFGFWLFHMSWANLTFSLAVSRVKGGFREAIPSDILSGLILWDTRLKARQQRGSLRLSMVRK